MADIFVSYARADRELLAPLVAALEAKGFSVWWDPAIAPGQEFDSLIANAIKEARALIVAWTPASVQSRWVRGEARIGADRGILVPVRFGDAELPIDVRSLHTTDLGDWRGDPEGAPFQELLRALRGLVGSQAGAAASSAPAHSSSAKVRMTTIVSIDVAGYSARTEADQAVSARQILALRSRLSAIALRHGGRIFNTAGDSVMLEFGAAKEAVAAICDLLDDRPLSEPETRIGAHLGDVTVASGGDLLGHGVNVAARLMAQAKPGRALISGELKGAVGLSVERPLHDMGELALAKMDSRIHAFEIAPAGAAAFVSRPQTPKLKPWQFGAATGALLIVIAAALLIFSHQDTKRSSPVGTSAIRSPSLAGGQGSLASSRANSEPQHAPAPAKPRIAILPFENLSPDPNNAFFTDGLHEEILTALANASTDLDVISRTTMDSYKGKPVTVEQLAKDLGCTHVLEGSVRREGNEVRVTLQLINARDDSHIWAQDYDRKLVSAMTLQSEVAKEVAGALSAKIEAGAGGAASSGGVTADPLAYDLYLKARLITQGLSGFTSTGDLRRALDLYGQALKIDPSILRAYADRIEIRTFLFKFGTDMSDANLNAAKEDLATLRKLAPDDALTLYAEGLMAIAEIDFAHALALFEAAEAKGFSDSALIAEKGQLLWDIGRFGEAEELERHLTALDPANGTRQYVWWSTLMELHRPQEAIDVANLGIARWQAEPAIADSWRNMRDITLFMFGNVPKPKLAEILASPPTLGNIDNDIDDLRYTNHIREARERIDAVGVDNLVTPDLYWEVTRVGGSPLADQRGWLDLFLGDKGEAAKDGGRVLDFIKRTPETRWNKWYFTLLRADAALFMGDDAAAIKSMDESVALTNATEDKSDQTNAKMWRALIYAWSGRKDEAAALLEGFATSIPGLWPGEVVHNPGWNIPLKDNPRYQALSARLIAQMKATTLQ